MKLRFEMAAVNEAEETLLWIEQHHPSQGEKFIDALAEAFRTISEHPLHHPKLETVMTELPERDIRRYPLRAFPHFVVYEIKHDVAHILAVVHPSRKPNYWIDRLD